MSLTSILNKEKGRSNLKNWFKYHFPNPGLKTKKEIIVNARDNSSAYSGEIGTAFDYLFRFALQRINKRTYSTRDKWVAEKGLDQILFKIGLHKEDKIFIGYKNDRIIDRVKFTNFLEKTFYIAQNNYLEFIKHGKLTTDLVKSAIFLAKLDLSARTQFIDSNLDKINPESIEELIELYNIIPWNKFKAKEKCLLNPSFGLGTKLVGGADADLIIDNTLIDIKTTKDLSINREDLNQIIGYCFLSFIDANQGGGNYNIEFISIYFVRYGELWQIPISEFCNQEKFEFLTSEFLLLVKDKNLQLVPSEYFNIKTDKKSTGKKSNKKLDRDIKVEFDFED